ncbi:MAG: PHP domain-containing protein [Candidatus Actinomarina sp.]|jgi:predicted metal-dependent phosphoesterase TrpH|nr:PHP domain-containing protein [Candidatus Actinomarina sp.]
MSIDLHLHSENSDGTDSPEAIIEKAIDIQLEAISITDHEYLTKVPVSQHIEIIRGVEVSVSWEKLEKSNPFAGIHLLLYFVKEESPVDTFLEKIRKLKNIRNFEIIENLQNEGLDVNKSELNDFKTKVPGRPHIASILKDKGYVDSINDAFIKYLGNGKIGDSRSHQPDIEKIISLSQESKCLVFLAHPHTLMSNDKFSKKENWVNDEFYELVKKLSEFGINGLETTYSSYSKNISNQISEVAKKLNLLECGGSDYHGDIKPNINLGFGYENTPMKVPYKFLNDMKEKHGQL